MSNGKIHLSILFADLVCCLLALFVSYFVRYDTRLSLAFRSTHANFLPLIGVSIVVWLLLYNGMELDCFRHGWQTAGTISRASLAVMFQFVIISTYGYFARLYYSRLVLLCYFGFLWVGILLIRFGVHAIVLAERRRGKARKVVLLGDYNLSREIAFRISRHPELLFTVVGFLAPFARTEGASEKSASSPTGLTSLETTSFIKNRGVEELIVCVQHAPTLEMQNFLAHCQQEGVRIHVVPQPYELYVSRPKLSDVDGIPLLCLDDPRLSPLAVTAKRVLDLTASLLLLVPAGAVIAVAGGILWIRERRFLRSEIRCGRDHKQFAMFRLDIETDEMVASDFHSMLHRLSISELPQILNVFRGEMSLVGPRPEALERVREYSEWQQQRLKVLPGMTGLAQVNGLREQNSSDEKTRFDLQYILHWSPLLDLILLLQTLWTLAGRLLGQRPAASHGDQGGSSVAEARVARAVEASWD